MPGEPSALIGYRAVDDPEGLVTPDFNWEGPSPGRSAVEAVYDLPKVRSRIDRDRLQRPHSQWDWQFLLPITAPESIVTLREGATPLLRNRRLGASLGLAALYVKDESRNPTGSFKDRGASVTASKCKESGQRGLTVASSGNLAASLAAYAAAADLEFCGFIRDDTTDTLRLQCLATGQRFFVVEGGMLEGTAIATEVSQRFGLFHAIQPYNLFRIEGKKTIAFEICQDLGWKAPDRVLIPTSGCTNVLALFKGFSELRELGWIDTMPAIDVVQPRACSPLEQAWRTRSAVQRSSGRTALLGLGHPFPAAGNRAIEIVNATGGRCLVADDEAVYDAQREVARCEGLSLQPASVTPIAALKDREQQQFCREIRDQVIVWIGTGSGKNQISEPLDRCLPPPRITGGIDEFLRLGAMARPNA
ncbi:MAG: pyridoxal-phosphate dependent enzyme [Betaproteobacteria bacterium]